jgi:hypothetical protein
MALFLVANHYLRTYILANQALPSDRIKKQIIKLLFHCLFGFQKPHSNTYKMKYLSSTYYISANVLLILLSFSITSCPVGLIMVLLIELSKEQKTASVANAT